VSHPEPVANRSHSLSDRELEVLQLLARGLGTRQISQTLQIGAGTISGYRRSIIQKLGLRGVARLTKYAVAAGLAPLTE
jgi:DNA-binding CsgD family transcriptional regulator